MREDGQEFYKLTRTSMINKENQKKTNKNIIKSSILKIR